MTQIKQISTDKIIRDYLANPRYQRSILDLKIFYV
jgi:hypothetical protein